MHLEIEKKTKTKQWMCPELSETCSVSLFSSYTDGTSLQLIKMA